MQGMHCWQEDVQTPHIDSYVAACSTPPEGATAATAVVARPALLSVPLCGQQQGLKRAQEVPQEGFWLLPRSQDGGALPQITCGKS